MRVVMLKGPITKTKTKQNKKTELNVIGTFVAET